MSAALEQLAGLVGGESGIALGRDRHRALAAAARRAAPELDDAGVVRALADPGRGPALLRRLIDEVTINETFFFRQMEELDALDWTALLSAARHAGGGGLRVWVAGCSTGEEVYTLAMLACEALGPVAPVAFLGTDISTDAIARAREGRYRRRSVRGVGAELRARYFERDGDQLVVGEHLRSLVRFARHNLTRDAMPPLREAPFDLVTCRNVLIYFDKPTVENVAAGLARATRPGGRLILGAADRISGAAAAPAARPPRTPKRRPTSERPTRPVPRSSDQGPGPTAVPRPPAEAPDRAAATPRPPAEAPDRAAATPRLPAIAPDLTAALAAADNGRLDVALAHVAAVIDADPLNADAHFVRGLVALDAGDAAEAAEALRRALYADPDFGFAAFQLGRAHEQQGDARAAVQAYRRALRVLDREDARPPMVADDVAPRDVAAVCRMRLRALESAATMPITGEGSR